MQLLCWQLIIGSCIGPVFLLVIFTVINDAEQRPFACKIIKGISALCVNYTMPFLYRTSAGIICQHETVCCVYIWTSCKWLPWEEIKCILILKIFQYLLCTIVLYYGMVAMRLCLKGRGRFCCCLMYNIACFYTNLLKFSKIEVRNIPLSDFCHLFFHIFVPKGMILPLNITKNFFSTIVER